MEGATSPDVSNSVLNYEVLFPHSCIWKNSLVSSISNQQLTNKSIKEEKPFDFKKHSHWFWISGGIGITVVTLVILSSYNQDRKSVPEVTIGF